MQSFLQYRRFRKTVQTQHEAASRRLHDAQADTSSAEAGRSPASSDISEDKDVEKGDAASDIPQQGVVEEEKADQEREEEEHEPPEADQDMRRYLQRMTTQRSTGTALGHAMTGVEVRKRSTKEGGEGNVYIVGYHDEKDPLNPHNWSYAIRIWITIMVASIGFVVGLASSIDSMALPQAAQEFGVSEVAEAGATGEQEIQRLLWRSNH